MLGIEKILFCYVFVIDKILYYVRFILEKVMLRRFKF